MIKCLTRLWKGTEKERSELRRGAVANEAYVRAEEARDEADGALRKELEKERSELRQKAKATTVARADLVGLAAKEGRSEERRNEDSRGAILSAQLDSEEASDEGNAAAVTKGQGSEAKREMETIVVRAGKRGLRGKAQDLRTMSDHPGLIKLDKRRSEPLQKNWQERMDKTKSAFFIDPR